MQVYGQLQNAALEILTSDPSTAVQGRIWYNQTTSRLMLDDGTLKLPVLRNDQRMVLGTNGTPANNIRLNRAASAVLQFVTGDDTTAEGTLSTSLAQISAKCEGYSFSGKPAAGNAGRVIYTTDLHALYLDNGSSWQSVAGAFVAPTKQIFTATGTTTGYMFTVTAANATAGSTYNHNGHTYTVLATIAGGTQLFCSQPLAPLASGTLNYATGTGDPTITFSANVALGTYTTPTVPTPVYLRARMVGAGGGGAGNGAGSSGGGSGSATLFGASLLLNAGGGASGGGGGQGGTASGGDLNMGGGSGSGGGGSSGSALGIYGARGGTTYFGGEGGGGNNSAGNGSPGATNSGAGGGGAGGTTTVQASPGGGGGGYVEKLITSPSATYVYAIGAGGASGANGTGGGSGGAGAAGVLIVEEFYQ